MLAVTFFRRGPESPEYGSLDDTVIRIRTGPGPWRLIARARQRVSRSGVRGSSVGGPVLDGGYVYWVRTIATIGEFTCRCTQDILRRPVGGGPVAVLERGGRLWVGAGPEGGDLALYSFSVAGGELFYRYGDTPAYVARVGPARPSFR